MTAEATKTFLREMERAKNASCVGCGWCCKKAPCAVARRVFGAVEECPALIYDYEEERYYCDLCRKPGELGAYYRQELAIGTGCCSPLFNTERDRVLNREDASDA